MTIAIQVKLPTDLVVRCRQLIDDGWAADVDELVANALRSYLQSHNSLLAETFLLEDVEWGLHGKE